MNKRALITGASSGIGFAYAKYLTKKDWHLDLVSNNKERSEESRTSLDYKKASFYTADLSKNESIRNIVDKFETPDLIVANAGVAINGPIGKLTDEEKSKAYYLMCGGVIELIEGFVPRMIDKGTGRIVIISSIGAISPMPKSSIYSSIKSGIYAYGKSIAAELSDKEINVTVSLPGYVKTSAHKRVGLEHLHSKVPSWMWVTPEKVVIETEKASRKGKNEIVPGIVYKIAKPFLKSNAAVNLWKKITKRSQ